MTGRPVLFPGDCRETMAALAFAGERFDAVVCDPPYDLVSVVKRFGSDTAAPAQHGRDGAFARQSRGFMGKQWDGTGIAFDPETWRAAWELLPPGGHLIAFGGTRTYHRMACAIEDAGFEIRDCLLWLYGTGFPKSHDVSKGIDKAAGAVREVIGHSKGRSAPIHGGGQSIGEQDAITAPATTEAAVWSGWGTALKPAVEPIVLARKPLAVSGRGATVAANVLAHGVGALNIDGCRIPLASDDKLQDGITGRDGEPLNDGSGWGFKAVDRAAGLGRWPANVLHDGSAEVVEAFPQSQGQLAPAKTDGSPRTKNVYGAMRRPTRGPGSHWNIGGERSPVPGGAVFNDSGSAARFFYSAKAGKSDRAGSKHPTVKPVALMRWLCRLVCPPGGRILDPFAGSGTTLQAAYEEGFAAFGCEREPDYIADIERRLASLNCAPRVSEQDTDADELAGFLS